MSDSTGRHKKPRIQDASEDLRAVGAAEIPSDPDSDTVGTFITTTGHLIMVNEGGWATTRIDVRVLVAWLRANRPELLA